MPRKISLELKVGSFVLLGFILLFIIIFSMGDFYIGKKGYQIRVVVELANGVSVGSPVRYAGVEVGRVEDVRLLQRRKGEKTNVELLIWLPDYVKIEEDAKAGINTLGLLGEKYLEIVPGTDGARTLSPGETLVVDFERVSFDELTVKGAKVLEDFDETLRSLHSIISDEQVRQSIKKTLSNSEDLTTQLTQTAKRVNDILADVQKGEGTLGKLLYDDKLYKELSVLVEDLKQNPWKLLYRPRKEKRR